MLLRIERHQLRMGMYIEWVEGAWLDVPFRFKSCKIADHDALSRLQGSALTAIVIDLERGVGPLEAPAHPAFPHPKAAPPRQRPVPPELVEASKVLDRTREAMRRVYAGFRDTHSVDAAGAGAVVDDIAAIMIKRPGALLGITRLKSKDEYSFLHSVAVCALMTHFGRFLRLDTETVRQLGMAGLLHDIGKLTLPSELLGKPGALSEEEAQLMQTHPVEGFRMLEGQDVPDLVRDVCLHHHERMDGRGYPDGLSGESLSLPVRIAAICDVYDAVTSVRAYKEAWSAGTAYSRMWKWEGHFDRTLLGQFFVSIGVARETQRAP